MANPPNDEDTSTKCFSGILRCLLCRGSLPTHPSDQFIESNTKEFGDQKPENPLQPNEEVKQITPGVVARLMGLDSFPDTLNLHYKDRTLGAYFRSRSANSIDFFSKFDHTTKARRDQGHRRVLTSVSFREGLHEDYGVAFRSLEKVDESDGCQKELVTKTSASVNCQPEKKDKGKLHEKSVGQKKVRIEEQRRLLCVKNQKKYFNGKNKLDLEGKRTNVKKPVEIKEALNGSSKIVKKKKKKENLDSKVHCDRRGLKKLHPESAVQEVPRVSHSEKSLASQIANSKRSCLSGGTHCDQGEVKAIANVGEERELKNDEKCYYNRMVEEIRRLTKENVQDNWIDTRLENYEETCQQFGQEILEVLLKQLVDELVIIYGTRD